MSPGLSHGLFAAHPELINGDLAVTPVRLRAQPRDMSGTM